MHDDDQPRPDPAAMSDAEWDAHIGPPNFRKHTTIATMDTRTFNTWCNSGKPALAGASGASPGRHVPATLERRTGGAARAEFEARLSTERRGIAQGMSAYVSKRLEAFAKMMGDELGVTHKEIAKEIAALRADAGYARDTNTAIGKQVDKIVTELAALKREHELEKKLEIQRTKRRVENLEIQLLAAGRVPDDGEDELPDKLSEWGRHAQQ